MHVGDLFMEKFAITQDVYDSFRMTFKDFNLLHTDDAYAKTKGFREKVMHGNILCGFLSSFVGELLPVKNTIIHSTEIVYKKPCYLNDVVHLEASLIEEYKSVEVYLFKFKFTVQDELRALGKLQIGILS